MERTCNEARFPSDEAACFLSASIELTRLSISEFFAAKASAIFDSTLVTSLLDIDKSCCSCFIRASYDLLNSLCQGSIPNIKDNCFNSITSGANMHKLEYPHYIRIDNRTKVYHLTSAMRSSSSCAFSDLYSWRRVDSPAQTWTLIAGKLTRQKRKGPETASKGKVVLGSSRVTYLVQDNILCKHFFELISWLT